MGNVPKTENKLLMKYNILTIMEIVKFDFPKAYLVPGFHQWDIQRTSCSSRPQIIGSRGP